MWIVFSILGRPKAEASIIVITCIVRVCYRSASVLFDPRSIIFYVSIYFSFSFNVVYKSLITPVYNSTSVGDSLEVIECVDPA